MNKVPVLKLRARDIADLIIVTPIEERAQLYQEIGKYLGQKGQYFSAKIFYMVGDMDEDGRTDG